MAALQRPYAKEAYSIMLNFSLKGVTAEELSFKVNKIKIDNPRFELKPSFARQIRKANDNEKILIVVLTCKIESTEAEPRPFDIHATYVGIFETDGEANNEERRLFAIKATEILLPFLRSGIANLTATAMINPLMLPVIPGDILFPDDRPASSPAPQNGGNQNVGKQYTLSFDENLLN